MIEEATNTTPIRPKTGIAKNTLLKHKKNNNNNSSLEESQSSSLNSEVSNDIQKINFFEGLTKGKQKKAFENLIKEEADRIDMIKKQKKQMNNINLLEKNYEDLYDWKTLFNKSRPISSYIKINDNNNKIKKEEETKETEFKFPIVLVDLNENDLNYYLQNNETSIIKTEKEKKINKRGKSLENKYLLNMLNKGELKKKKKIGNCIRPLSIYSKRNKNDIFYFSQTFSDYYNEDLKDFAKKMPLLKPKITQNSSKLKYAIKKAYKENEKREIKLSKILNSDNLILNKQDVIIAGKSGNPVPLLKSVFHQIHPNKSLEYFKEKKLYLKSSSNSLGKNFSVDYIRKNKKKKINNENNNNNNKNEGLIISTYNKNDPALLIFNKIKEEENAINENEEYENIELNNNTKKINENNINKYEKTNDNNKLIINKENLNIKVEKINLTSNIKINTTRSRTGISKVNNQFKKQNSTRPKTSKDINRIKSTSNISSLNTHQSTDSTSTQEHNFIPKNIFPLRPPSGEINVIYKRINEKLQNQNYEKNFHFDDFNNFEIPKSFSTKNINKKKQEFNKKNNQNKVINDIGMNKMSKWEFESNKDGRNQYISSYNFNEYIDTFFSDKIKDVYKNNSNYFYPTNFFNKSNQMYSCSNNAHVNAKRIKKKEIINSYFDEDNNFDNNKKRRLYSVN